MVDDRFYHLDTCFAPLSESVALINRTAFSSESLALIDRCFARIMVTGETDNRVLGCNVVVLGKQMLVSRGISKKLQDQLTGLGFTVHLLAMSEFLRSGGSVKCLSLVL